MATKAATIACAIDGFLNPNTPRLRGKAIRTRAVGYTIGVFLVPAIWRILPDRGRYPRGLDLAVTLLEGKPPSGVNSLPLLKLPLILLVAKSSRLTSPEDLWKRDKIEETLISLPPYEAIPKHFQQGLSRLGIDWFPRIEVSSLALIETYVDSGYGIGLSVAVPRSKLSPKIRAVPLGGFTPVTLAALWPGKLTPLIQAFLEELQRRAQSLTS